MDKQTTLPTELPEPWPWTASDLTIQLFKELPTKHPLLGKSLRSLARRQDNDDVLLQIDNANFKYAIVHLTWSSKRSMDPNYPKTRLFSSWEEVFTNRILPDHEFFTSLD